MGTSLLLAPFNNHSPKTTYHLASKESNAVQYSELCAAAIRCLMLDPKEGSTVGFGLVNTRTSSFSMLSFWIVLQYTHRKRDRLNV